MSVLLPTIMCSTNPISMTFAYKAVTNTVCMGSALQEGLECLVIYSRKSVLVLQLNSEVPVLLPNLVGQFVFVG